MKKLYIFALLVAFLVTSAVADDDPPPRGKAATITIITNPPNSDVFLGGEPLGKSPIENASVKSGRQTLVVIDQGYELVNQRVNIWPGNDKRNVFDFGTKIPKGAIKVTTIPGKCLILGKLHQPFVGLHAGIATSRHIGIVSPHQAEFTII